MDHSLIFLRYVVIDLFTSMSLSNIMACLSHKQVNNMFTASHSSHLRLHTIPSSQEKHCPYFTAAVQSRDPPLRRVFFSLYGPIKILLSEPEKYMVRFIHTISGDSEPSNLNH